jgi:hypothetical protein
MEVTIINFFIAAAVSFLTISICFAYEIGALTLNFFFFTRVYVSSTSKGSKSFSATVEFLRERAISYPSTISISSTSIFTILAGEVELFKFSDFAGMGGKRLVAFTGRT